MDNREIIDIEPIEVSSTKLTPESEPLGSDCASSNRPGGQTHRTTSSAKGKTRAYTVMFDSRAASERKPSRLVGLIQIIAGALLTLIGVPLLILPGPGLLAIGAGLALIVIGAKKLFGSRPSYRGSTTSTGGNTV